MVFSFKYKSIIIPSGDVIRRPMIPLTIEGMDIIAILDSGSDMTIIPKEIAKELKLDYIKDNEVSGISGNPIKAKEARARVEFGKGREVYKFDIPALIPQEEINCQIIIGRAGFFEQFKIIFCEAERRIEFKKVFQQIRY